MRRLLIFGMLAAGMFLAMRKMAERAGPVMRERGMEMCDRFLASMPESFPPNRMMADLDALKEQTARILEVLEERQDPGAKQTGEHVQAAVDHQSGRRKNRSP